MKPEWLLMGMLAYVGIGMILIALQRERREKEIFGTAFLMGIRIQRLDKLSNPAKIQILYGILCLICTVLVYLKIDIYIWILGGILAFMNLGQLNSLRKRDAERQTMTPAQYREWLITQVGMLIISIIVLGVIIWISFLPSGT